jgi:hypothetical protein
MCLMILCQNSLETSSALRELGVYSRFKVTLNRSERFSHGARDKYRILAATLQMMFVDWHRRELDKAEEVEDCALYQTWKLAPISPALIPLLHIVISKQA